MTPDEQVTYLLSIKSVRERSSIVFQKALKNKLNNFDIDLNQIPKCVNFIKELILRDYNDPNKFNEIPSHGRWQHFNVGGIDRISNLIELIKKQNNGIVGKEEEKLIITKSLIDLFLISVLLDAGAGDSWLYKTKDGFKIGRSEGIAIASYYMFINGKFSNDDSKPYQINGDKLINFKNNDLIDGFQINNNNNQFIGIEGRCELIRNLGKSLNSKDNENYFGYDHRGGNLIDYLIKLSTENDNNGEIDLNDLWDLLMYSLTRIWPEGRTKLNNKSLGDSWHIKVLKEDKKQEEWEDIVTFHKLTQWLCYSLIVPIKKILNLKIKNESLQTGLPEYRNGGLLIDFKIINLKSNILKKGFENSSIFLNEKNEYNLPTFKPNDDIIIEWRSITIGFLDYLLPLVNESLGVNGTINELSLPQLLEAGSWKAGREIAKKLRPNTGGPPINLYSDGTVF